MRLCIIFTNIWASFPMTFVFIFLLLDVVTDGSSSFTLFGLLSTLVSLKWRQIEIKNKKVISITKPGNVPITRSPLYRLRDPSVLNFDWDLKLLVKNLKTFKWVVPSLGVIENVFKCPCPWWPSELYSTADVNVKSRKPFSFSDSNFNNFLEIS